VPAFYWIGNHPGLDFVNTAAVDGGGRPVDLLREPADLLDWIGEAGLAAGARLDAARRATTGPAGDALLAWARQLRLAARRLLDPSAAPSEGDAAELDTLVGAVPVRLAHPGAGADPPLATTGDAADEMRLVLARAVLAALALDPGGVRRCAGARCVLLFHDTSRNGSRRWCDMATCGNRAKAAAHYRRHRAPARSA
jgi:predicted RNA-binding Zn ribbon-like protein